MSESMKRMSLHDCLLVVIASILAMLQVSTDHRFKSYICNAVFNTLSAHKNYKYSAKLDSRRRQNISYRLYSPSQIGRERK